MLQVRAANTSWRTIAKMRKDKDPGIRQVADLSTARAQRLRTSNRVRGTCSPSSAPPSSRRHDEALDSKDSVTMRTTSLNLGLASNK